ncbi:MAG: bifunctional adenosylcobinamide kinase/adenosylcobinamide-phosphate guanylyltransferase [bacterium]|nr:bifunctional adenosylcobinamide kinase/adenosylcobinamide-phosphate guanylyltransferase [bacterium]
MKPENVPQQDRSLTLVVGGARSGKSRFAQQLATELGGDEVLFVATAQALDAEMKSRISHHQSSRPSTWRTLESPLQVGDAVKQLGVSPTVVLIDCLTLLVSNIVCSGDATCDFDDLIHCITYEVDQLIELAQKLPRHVIIVSGEVGAGLVPTSELGRNFRDLLGWANQRLASHADATYFMVAGLPINATSLACSVGEAADLARRNRPSTETSLRSIE